MNDIKEQLKRAKISITVISHKNGKNEVELISQMNIENTVQILKECTNAVAEHLPKINEDSKDSIGDKYV
ncbi:hypothetical protein MKC54_09755 [[Clostridium] innocuum]|nr:hypothetical protein [[Clostridium] innocuum]MCR0577171.1 hypothetical protein [[Clostridium] innocuum]